MATITKFENLIAWQEVRKLVKMIYKMTSNGSLSKDFAMRDQVQRAGGGLKQGILKNPRRLLRRLNTWNLTLGT